jgi:uncharacterized protein (DUF2249 family)
MTISFVEVDVRPTLRAGGEPFGEIMNAVNALKPGEGLRLLATFKPVPLLSVLGSKGFEHQMRELDDGDWEVLFSPSASARTQPQADAAGIRDDGSWPEPLRHMDNRDLDPPEPMVRILAATEEMAPGEVLSALLCREPVFLLPELAKRGHAWNGGFEPDGTTYKILVRIGESRGAPPRAAA